MILSSAERDMLDRSIDAVPGLDWSRDGYAKWSVDWWRRTMAVPVKRSKRK